MIFFKEIPVEKEVEDHIDFLNRAIKASLRDLLLSKLAYQSLTDTSEDVIVLHIDEIIDAAHNVVMRSSFTKVYTEEVIIAGILKVVDEHVNDVWDMVVEGELLYIARIAELDVPEITYH